MRARRVAVELRHQQSDSTAGAIADGGPRVRLQQGRRLRRFPGFDVLDYRRYFVRRSHAAARADRPRESRGALRRLPMLSILFAVILAAPGALRPQPKTVPPQAEEVTPKTELSDDDVREHVKAYLGSIDTPIHANQWKALGPRAVPMLEEIAKNHDELPTRRAKAIDGLAAV